MVESSKNMIYRYLGKTGLTVSALGFGNWLNNDKLDSQVEEMTYQCMKLCYEKGINFFDTAEMYGEGKGEICMGKALKKAGWSRNNYVITTKIFFGGNKENDKGLSRKHIIEGLKRSLTNLQLDYVDVVFAHRPDPATPMEEIVRAFNWCIENNLAFYWGTSMWKPQEIMEANEICERLLLIKPIVEQPEYNMIVRTNVEVDLIPLYSKYGLGVTSWSPLCGGILTGKYLNTDTKSGFRLGDKIGEFYANFLEEKYYGKDKEITINKLKSLVELANELKCTPAQLALAWCVANKDNTVTLMGASTPSQIEDNIKCIEIVKKWDLKIEKRISNILDNTPTPPTDWKTFSPLQPHREGVLLLSNHI